MSSDLSHTRSIVVPARTPAPRAARELVIVGAGRWGALHAEKLAGFPGVRLVAIVDPDLERARSLAARWPGSVALPGVEMLEHLPAMPTAALVATTIDALGPVTRELLLRRVHVLVEKPAAQSSADALHLAGLALEMDRVLAVGFVERFNGPRNASPGQHRRMVVRRAGAGSSGAGRLDLDWLVHDLDLAGWLLGGPLTVVGARTPHEDRLSVRLSGPDGRSACLEVLRGRPRTYRRLWLDGERTDLAAPRARDALGAQWRAFLAAVEGEPAPDLARGEAAVAALSLVEAVRRVIELGRRSERVAG